MVYIYGLTDPRTGELRYIGKTKNSLKYRLMRHVRYRDKGSVHKNSWIGLLERDGLRPEIFVIEEVEDSI